MKRSRLDDAFLKASIDLSQRMSRRGLLGLIGKLSAGVTFLSVLGSGMGTAFAKKEPRRARDPFCVPKDPNCALNGHPCAPFGNSSPGVDCSNCIQPGDPNHPLQKGCPAGTIQAGSWAGCCPCSEPDKAGKGTEVTYNDCCGFLDHTRCPKGCKAGPRITPSFIGTVPNPSGRGTKPQFGNCFSPPGAFGSYSNWCDETNGGAHCTQVNVGTTCCLPLERGKPCET